MSSPRIVAKKLARLADDIADERGEMSLFALVQREESFGWDLLVAAPWVRHPFDTIVYVAEKLPKYLSVKDVMLIGRITPIEESHPLCDVLRRAEALGMTSCVIRAGDLEVRDAHVISPKMAA